MDWSEFFESFIHGIIIGIGVYFFYYYVYNSVQNKIMYLEKRVSTFEERIKNQNNTVHKHRDFFEIEISRIYDKLEKQKE